MMRNVRLWWPRVSVAGVLTVLAVAMVLGLRPAPGQAVAARSSELSRPAATALESPTPGALLAPISARGSTASSGAVAYALVGGALTLADIPTPALAAYQRAAAVMDLADSKCHLDWELVAALGKVLTDHGRTNGSQFDDKGVSRPALLGERLSGRHGTARVADTDGGLVDRDSRFDRAIGPMLLLPSVWSVVNVDADADGRRNPQDVDDAALSAAVLLCAGPGDFRNVSHVRDEVRRYHSGAGYTRSVLGVRAAYRDAQPVSTTVSVLAREEGVSPEAGLDTVAVSGGSSFSAEDTFVPAASPGVHPTQLPSSAPSPSPSSGSAPPTPGGEPSPTGTPAPSEDPSPTGEPTPTGDPSEDPCPTADPSATVDPTSDPSTDPSFDPTVDPSATGCPEPTESAEPSEPAEPGRARSHAAPAAGTAVLLPGAAWLWWRRRRPRASA